VICVDSVDCAVASCPFAVLEASSGEVLELCNGLPWWQHCKHCLWLNVSSHFFHHRVVSHQSSFSVPVLMAAFRQRPANTGPECRWSIKQLQNLTLQNLTLFQKWYKIVAMVCDLSNGAISSDLEWYSKIFIDMKHRVAPL